MTKHAQIVRVRGPFSCNYQKDITQANHAENEIQSLYLQFGVKFLMRIIMLNLPDGRRDLTVVLNMPSWLYSYSPCTGRGGGRGHCSNNGAVTWPHE